MLGCAAEPTKSIDLPVSAAVEPALKLSIASPSEAGFSAPALRLAEDLFVSAVEEEKILGFQLLVARRGRVALHSAGGFSDTTSGKPMTTSTLLNVASMTKSVVAVAILKLADEGRLSIDDPVAQYLAGFDSEASKDITIRQLLLHTAGYTSFEIFCDGLTPRSPDEPTAPSLIVEARELGERGPEVEPGTRFRYNNLGYNALGAIIETISGMRLEEYLRLNIYTPLGMDSTLYDTEITGEKDYASQYWFRNGAWEKLDTSGIAIPRANGGLVSNAWDFAKFCQMLLNGGRYGEHRVLEAETVALATAPLIEVSEAYLPPQVERDMGFEFEWFEYRDTRGLGIDTHRGLGFVVSDTGAFSHAGIYGTFFYVDPNLDLVILILTQSIYGGNPGQAFIEAVTEAVI